MCNFCIHTISCTTRGVPCTDIVEHRYSNTSTIIKFDCNAVKDCKQYHTVFLKETISLFCIVAISCTVPTICYKRAVQHYYNHDRACVSLHTEVHLHLNSYHVQQLHISGTSLVSTPSTVQSIFCAWYVLLSINAVEVSFGCHFLDVLSFDKHFTIWDTFRYKSDALIILMKHLSDSSPRSDEIEFLKCRLYLSRNCRRTSWPYYSAGSMEKLKVNNIKRTHSPGVSKEMPER